MSSHNICFRGQIRKIFTGYLPLSRPVLMCPVRSVHMKGKDQTNLLHCTWLGFTFCTLNYQPKKNLNSQHVGPDNTNSVGI